MVFLLIRDATWVIFIVWQSKPLERPIILQQKPRNRTKSTYLQISAPSFQLIIEYTSSKQQWRGLIDSSPLSVFSFILFLFHFFFVQCAGACGDTVPLMTMDGRKQIINLMSHRSQLFKSCFMYFEQQNEKYAIQSEL